MQKLLTTNKKQDYDLWIKSRITYKIVLVFNESKYKLAVKGIYLLFVKYSFTMLLELIYICIAF